MYSYKERKKVVELYIQYGYRAAAVVRALGYPNRHTLKRWAQEFKTDKEFLRGLLHKNTSFQSSSFLLRFLTERMSFILFYTNFSGLSKTLDDFDFSFQPSIDKRQIDELATMRFLENGENVVFLGPPGVGKTHLASALGLVAAQHRFSTYYINCHQLIEQLKKAHFENRLPDKLKVLSKYRMLIIDEIGYLPMDIQGANLFFQLIARRYEKTSTVFTSNKTFSQWNEVFADVTIASAILDRVLHHCTVINIKGESYRLKERKEFMRQKQQIVNTLFLQGNN